MENLAIFYDHLAYFTAIGNILWPFGVFCGNLVYFPPFWYFGPRKIWQPCFRAQTQHILQIAEREVKVGGDPTTDNCRRPS
jgi:hypothetical protein